MDYADFDYCATRHIMPESEPHLVPLPLLADPESYRPCETNLLDDHESRIYWLGVFRSHTRTLLDAARACGYSARAAARAKEQWDTELEILGRDPAQYGRLDILWLDERRRAVFDRHGIDDECAAIKKRENDEAIQVLPQWLTRLDELRDFITRMKLIVRGQLAGNLFDMGVPDLARQFADQGPSFEEALGRVPARPWFIDDLDEACRWIATDWPRKVMIFADNAGGDFVLGVLPLVREFLRNAAVIILAANDRPSHNDVTVDDVVDLLDRASAVDPIFKTNRIQVLSNGHAAPLLDLRQVSCELASAAAGTNLVVLIGMGRAIESNFTAALTCPTWRIAMLKDPHVARSVGGRLFDAVCRFDMPSV